jgi:hypothetical protein
MKNYQNSNNSLPIRLYKLGLLLGILWFLGMLLGTIVHTDPLVLRSFSEIFIFGSSILIVFAFINECVSFTKKHWNSLVFKGFLAITLSGSGIASSINSRLLINSITGVDPSSLAAVSLFTVLLTPLVLSLAAAAVFILIYISGILGQMLLLICLPFFQIFVEARNSYFHRLVFRNERLDFNS